MVSILKFLRPGNALVVVKLDCLGRSTRDVLKIVHDLDRRDVSLRILEPPIDTGGSDAKAILTTLAMVADMELGFIRDRQRAGKSAAESPPRPNASFAIAAKSEKKHRGQS